MFNISFKPFRSLLIAESLPIGTSLLYGAPNYNKEGSPQLGQVFLVNVSSIPSQTTIFPRNLEGISYDVLEGEERMGKFGWQIAIVDINKDGIDDIAISAPSQGTHFSTFISFPLAILKDLHFP